MKIGAVTLAYNDEATISGTIKCLKDVVDKHIVLISEKPYFGESSEADRTEEICRDLDVEVIKGVWELDHKQRTLGNIMCSDCDWVLGFDSDEMMTRVELDKLVKHLEVTKSQAVAIRPLVYWKTTDFILDPKPDYAPIIAMKPSVKFSYIRNINSPFEIVDLEMHHLSWCYPKDILKKVTTYAHATDFNGEQWYDTQYLPWKESRGYALMPDKSIYNVIKKPLPKELCQYLAS